MKINRVKKLKSIAAESLTVCWGECVAILIIAIGAAILFAVSALLAAHALEKAGVIRYSIEDMSISAPKWFYAALAAYLLLFYMLLMPLKYGIYWFCYQTVRGRSMTASCFFSCYTNRSHFFKTILLSILVQLIRSAASVPFHALAAAEMHLAGRILDGTGSAAHIIAASAAAFLLICAFVFQVFVTLRYMFIPYVYIDDPEADIKQIFIKNRRCVSGNIMYMLRTALSFFGWIFAGVLIFPYIFAVPYFLMTFAALAKDVMGSGKKGRTAAAENGDGKKEDTVLV